MTTEFLKYTNYQQSDVGEKFAQSGEVVEVKAPEPYYEEDDAVIYNANCLDILRLMDDCCIDLTVTSPPYDNLRTYQGYEFDFEGIAKELYRVTKQGGVVVWVVGDATVNGSETGTSFRQALYFKDSCGFNLHDTMIYQKANYIPLTHNRYEQEFEYMFVFTRGIPKTFNPIKKKNSLFGKSYNPKRPRSYDNHSIRHNRDEVLTYKEYSNRGNIFDYIVGAGSEKTNHPASFPEALANDHIRTWSNPGDTILDPMCGSGTTGKMARKNGCRFIGADVSRDYCSIAARRLQQGVLDFG